MNKVTTASAPDKLFMTELDAQLKNIPNIKALGATRYSVLLNSLRNAVGFHLAGVDWDYGKAGRRPDVVEPVLMHDIENAFHTAGIAATVWNDLEISRNECDLFKVYRCTHKLIAGLAPQNLKHIHKNSKKIK